MRSATAQIIGIERTMIELDLNEILRDTHTDLFTVHNVTGQCKCGEYVGQNQHICPYCKEPISWKHSKLWTRTFLEGEGSDFAKRFLKKVGVKKFKDGREYHRWRLLHLAIPESETLAAVDRCRGWLKDNGKATPRAVMRFTLNYLEKKLPEEGDIIDDLFDSD